MQQMQSSPDRDPELWEIAKSRASFRSHLATYVVVNILLWVLWLLTVKENNHGEIPWPVWSTAGWGIGILFHYLGAYVFPKSNSVEKEYEKLKNRQNK